MVVRSSSVSLLYFTLISRRGREGPGRKSLGRPRQGPQVQPHDVPERRAGARAARDNQLLRGKTFFCTAKTERGRGKLAIARESRHDTCSLVAFPRTERKEVKTTNFYSTVFPFAWGTRCKSRAATLKARRRPSNQCRRCERLVVSMTVFFPPLFIGPRFDGLAHPHRSQWVKLQSRHEYYTPGKERKVVLLFPPPGLDSLNGLVYGLQQRSESSQQDTPSPSSTPPQTSYLVPDVDNFSLSVRVPLCFRRSRRTSSWKSLSGSR